MFVKMDVNCRRFTSKIDSTKYFSWGDIRGQNKNGTGSYSFSQANYEAGVCGAGSSLTKDLPQGNFAVDAARANMGSHWKMPTKNQCQELIDGTNHTWITLNGVNGMKFTSKTDTSKYIFLPAPGTYSNSNNTQSELIGFYWTTNTIIYSSTRMLAYHIKLYSTNLQIDYLNPSYGCSVRAIYIKNKENSLSQRILFI